MKWTIKPAILDNLLGIDPTWSDEEFIVINIDTDKVHIPWNKGKKGVQDYKRGLKISIEQKEKQSEIMSKIWVFKNPAGQKIIIKNLTKYCKNNNLTYTCMWRLYYGKRNVHKGWTKWQE